MFKFVIEAMQRRSKREDGFACEHLVVWHGGDNIHDDRAQVQVAMLETTGGSNTKKIKMKIWKV